MASPEGFIPRGSFSASCAMAGASGGVGQDRCVRPAWRGSGSHTWRAVTDECHLLVLHLQDRRPSGQRGLGLLNRWSIDGSSPQYTPKLPRCASGHAATRKGQGAFRDPPQRRAWRCRPYGGHPRGPHRGNADAQSGPKRARAGGHGESISLKRTMRSGGAGYRPATARRACATHRPLRNPATSRRGAAPLPRIGLSSEPARACRISFYMPTAPGSPSSAT
jgi:hypothetical protein